MSSSLKVILALLTASLSACGGAVLEDSEALLAEGKADSARARLAGSYRGSGARRSQLAWLELRRDGTFASGEVVICAVAPCNPARFEGRFTTRLDSLYLTDRRGRVEYTYRATQETNGSKRLVLTRDGRSQTLRTSAAAQCGRTVCTGGTVCCNASCGICTPPGNVCIQVACQ